MTLRGIEPAITRVKVWLPNHLEDKAENQCEDYFDMTPPEFIPKQISLISAFA